MKKNKFINISFAIGLVIWFITALYLSVNSIINIFVDTNPNIAKFMLAASFTWLAVLGTYNYKKGGDITNIREGIEDLKTKKPKQGCKSCKQKK